ncbi:hypothetical protein [uncultured Roseicyclus sp.]|jgi:hypothetical protein|uniref:hypothetical protein n=1 Tax=uncultured Roseicyclus sp. TaxID=543072 RepID=UPI002609BF7D|nr:hypothetical protein [uncultured Roseicyclus sp.]
MTRKSTTHIGDMMDQARAVLSANPAIAPQMAQFWKAQDQMLQDAETYSQAWFARRHVAIKSALDALGKSDGAGGIDPARSVQLALEWQRQSLQRMADDMQQWMTLCTRCAGHMTEAEIEAGKEGAEHLVKQVAATTPVKHATPV